MRTLPPISTAPVFSRGQQYQPHRKPIPSAYRVFGIPFHKEPCQPSSWIVFDTLAIALPHLTSPLNMFAAWRYRFAGWFILGFLWGIQCMAKPTHEEIVGSSEGIVSAVTPSSTTTTDLPSILEPKDLAAQITTEGLEKYMSTVYCFYKQGTVMRDLDQTNSKKDDYLFMKKSLEDIRNGYDKISHNGNPLNARLSENIEKLQTLHELILLEMKNKIYTSKDNGSRITDIKMLLDLYSTQQISKLVTSEEDLVRDVVEKVRGKVFDFDDRCKHLNNILHDIASFKIGKTIDLANVENQLALKLQHNVFQTVAYMYNQDMITEEAFQNFYELKNTMEVAAINMITTICIKHPTAISRGKDVENVLRNWYCSNSRALLGALQGSRRRKFLNLCLQVILEYLYKNSYFASSQIINDSDKMFATLEKYVDLKSLPKSKLEPLQLQDPEYLQVKEAVDQLLGLFGLHDSDTLGIHNIGGYGKKAFVCLKIIEENYGEIIMDIETQSILKERLNLVSSSFQFIEELSNIRWYLEHEFNSNLQVNGDGSNLTPAQEIILIYKYYEVILAKQSSSTSALDLQRYSQPHDLAVEITLTKIAISKELSKYYGERASYLEFF
ncbi:hypothetical protein KEM48_013751 [Puccinia striiformis f. sp. tritici PST-130]|nr:hypothetical protein Pst134EB_014135 [Puccinia striiformis f. sp. tritici]KAI9630597.1 hypothetical protein KEM48_013751 [Puccinia striiformis f. sp. tritici PST-130]